MGSFSSLGKQIVIKKDRLHWAVCFTPIHTWLGTSQGPFLPEAKLQMANATCPLHSGPKRPVPKTNGSILVLGQKISKYVFSFLAIRKTAVTISCNIPHPLPEALALFCLIVGLDLKPGLVQNIWVPGLNDKMAPFPKSIYKVQVRNNGTMDFSYLNAGHRRHLLPYLRQQVILGNPGLWLLGVPSRE